MTVFCFKNRFNTEEVTIVAESIGKAWNHLGKDKDPLCYEFMGRMNVISLAIHFNPLEVQANINQKAQRATLLIASAAAKRARP